MPARVRRNDLNIYRAVTDQDGIHLFLCFCFSERNRSHQLLVALLTHFKPLVLWPVKHGASF